MPDPPKKQARKKIARDEDRYVAAMQAVDKADVFIMFAVVRDAKGEPQLEIHASDDYSGHRLLADGCPMYDMTHTFNLDVDVSFEDEDEDGTDEERD